MTVISRGQMQFIELIQEKATQYGLCLEIIELDQHWFRLSYSDDKELVWSCDLWPSIICSGILPKKFDEKKSAHVPDYEPCQIKWNDPHRGPMLNLPRRWTLLDVVEAMYTAKLIREI